MRFILAESAGTIEGYGTSWQNIQQAICHREDSCYLLNELPVDPYELTGFNFRVFVTCGDTISNLYLGDIASTVIDHSTSKACINMLDGRKLVFMLTYGD